MLSFRVYNIHKSIVPSLSGSYLPSWFNSDLYFPNRQLSWIGLHRSTMWTIMPFLHQGLIVYN